jgi:DNA repair protein RadC
VTDEHLAEGGGAEVGGCLRPLVARAFELGSRAVVLVHNHPSGEASPSLADVAVTRRLSRSLGELEIVLFDHLIVGGTTIHSMRGAGQL